MMAAMLRIAAPRSICAISQASRAALTTARNQTECRTRYRGYFQRPMVLLRRVDSVRSVQAGRGLGLQ